MDRDPPRGAPAAKPISGRLAVILLLIATLLVGGLLVGGVSYSLYGPNLPPTVSPETTRITEPLLASGWPDYEEWLRREWRGDVTPETNGAIPFWRAMLSNTEVDPNDIPAFCDELGMAPPEQADLLEPPRGFADKTLHPWVIDRVKQSDQGATSIDQDAGVELMRLAMRRAWTAQDVPVLAEWRERNARAFEHLREAATQRHFYLASPSFFDDEPTPLTEIEIPGTQAAREAARALCLRAMGQLGAGEHAGAWEDTLAAFRLASLLEQGPFYIDLLVARAIRNLAGKATLAIVADPQCPAPLPAAIRSAFQAVPPPPSVLSNRLVESRLFAVSDAYAVFADGASLEYSDVPRPQYGMRVDFDIVLQEINRLLDAAEPVEGEPIEATLARIADVERQLNDRLAKPILWIDTVSLPERSRRLGREIVARVQSVSFATYADRRDQRWRAADRLFATALAIVAEQRRSGAWPTTLDEVGDLTEAERTSWHSDEPLRYRVRREGFLLYDPGPNGTDDGGSFRGSDDYPGDPSLQAGEELGPDDPRTEKVPEGADDVAIRFPPPVEAWPWERANSDAGLEEDQP